MWRFYLGVHNSRPEAASLGLVVEHWRSASKTRLTTHLFPFRARATRDPKVETSSLPSVVVARVASGNDVLLLLGLARFRGALALEEVVLDAVLLAVRGELLLAVFRIRERNSANGVTFSPSPKSGPCCRHLTLKR